MAKHLHGWLLAIGVMLILAGIAVLIRLDSAGSASAQLDRPRIVEAVVDLQSCFCHEVPIEAPALVHHADHTGVLVANLRTQPEFVQRANVDTRLIAAGQRILALPDTLDKPAQAVSTGYLRIYDQTRLNAPTGETLAALDQLEFWLGLLENRAQTTRWSSARTMPSPPDESAWQTVSPVTRDYSAVFAWVDAVPDVSRLFVRLGDDHRAVSLAATMFGVHHRGPPAGAIFAWV